MSLLLLIILNVKYCFSQTISTALGDVTGTTSNGVNIFSDIPYTENAPTGNLRWTPMTVRTSSYSSNPFIATSSSKCVQYDGGVEDCLKLNIYTKDTTASLPVMVWIHGGSFTMGDGYTYNGISFALNNVVYVSINYRLGAFGFLPKSEIFQENGVMNGGLFGVHDQIIALQWIKQNIGDYGGDPNKVTIFGESAGSLSVCALVFSPVATNLFTKAIMQSGSCNGPWGPGPKIMENYHSLSNTDLATLRSRTVDELRNVGATVAVDGYVLTNEDVFSIGSALNADKIMVGVTSLDTLFLSGIANGAPENGWELQHYINEYFGTTGDTLYNSLTSNYYKITDFQPYSSFNEYGILWLTMSADACLVCPTFYLSEWIVSQSSSIFNGNAYLYHFLGTNTPYFLAHAGELGYVFNWGNEDATLSNITHTAWLNFAMDIVNTNLEPYSSDKQNSTIFGGANTIEIINNYFDFNYRSGVCKWWETQSTSILNDMCWQNKQITIPSSPQPTMTTSSPIPTTTAPPIPTTSPSSAPSALCPNACKNPQCTIYADGGENEAKYINGECTGTCMSGNCPQIGACTICAALSNWGNDWTPTDCTMCSGGAPIPCVNNCRLCPPSNANQTFFRGGICTGICVYASAAPEYQFGFCQDPLWAQYSADARIDCRTCNENSQTTIILPDVSVPNICINSGITSHGGYGYNIKHCSVDINNNYCDIYQETNGDPIINPTANCDAFCQYFGLRCIKSWGDPDNGCPMDAGWNTWTSQYTCQGVGDPPYDNNNIGYQFSPDQICRCAAPTGTSDPTNTPSKSPTKTPTNQPSNSPTIRPSESPITPGSPTKSPTITTLFPSKTPTKLPTLFPSINPTQKPSRSPLSGNLTYNPTISPTLYPSNIPTNNPIILTTTNTPSNIPTNIPTNNPIIETTDDSNDSNECDISWLIKIRFRLKFLLDPNDTNNNIRYKIKQICKIAFYKTILKSIWQNIFCFDLFDTNLKINEYSQTRRRRRQLLVNSQYEIETLFEYNNELQNEFFKSNNFNKENFKIQFANEICSLAVENGLIDTNYCQNVNTADTMIIDDAIQNNKIKEKNNKNNGMIIVIVIIIICILCVIICIGIIYFYKRKDKAYIDSKIDGDNTSIQIGNTENNGESNDKKGILSETNEVGDNVTMEKDPSIEENDDL